MCAIPPDINELCMADAFVRYRDTVGLHVYPVHPPWADVKDPGKQPAFKKWWDADPHNCNVERYFKIKRPYNIGVCPEPPFIFVDLDSKPDRGASVREYLAAHPELEKIPSHVSRGGVHLVFVCEDLPVFLDDHGNRYMAALRLTYLMRGLFRFVQCVDGHKDTQHNADGILPVLMKEAGFAQVEETTVIPTPTGSVSLYRAIRSRA